MTAIDDASDITELEKFTPERVDGVDLPANGSSFLMLKALGTEPAPESTEKAVAPVTEAPQDQAPNDGAPEPGATAGEAAAAKSAAPDPGMVNVDILAGASVSISPADLAKLATFKRQLVLQDRAEKKDVDPNVGGGVDRDKLPASAFAFPETRDFPVVKPGDVSDAVSSWGRYKGKETFAAFKSKLTALARRKGPKFAAKLPKAWADGEGGAAKAKPRKCPDCGAFAKAGDSECGECGKELEKKARAKGKGKAFPGAAPPFKAKDADADKDDDEKASKAGRACKCGCAMAKGDKFCAQCGSPASGKGAKAEKGKIPSPEDAAVAGAIGRAKDAIGDAIDAQDKDPDKDTHPADAKVSAHLDEAKHAIGNADDAQDEDIKTDEPQAHGIGKAAAEPPAYHLARLHDATCAAYRHEDVVIAHPSVAKGISELVDPQSFAAMTQAALADDGGTGSRAHEIPVLSAAFAHAVTLKAAAAAGGLDDAMAELRKAFAEYYPDAHPSPGGISPGEFRRPYVSAGHASQSAKPGQDPRIPMASHVPEASDFRRPLITAGRESASPGSNPSGVGKARSYYTNATRDGATAALTSMHDWIADNHPGVCPMTGTTYDGEPGRPGSMGSSVSTAQPVPAQFAATKDKAVPVAVPPSAQAAAVTPSVTKAERKAAKAARKAAEMAQAQEAPAAGAAPAIDPEVLNGMLRKVVAEGLGDVTKTIGDLSERLAAMESAPDPAQMAPRSGTAMAKNASTAPEVPAGGDGHQVERLARLVKRAKDPDSNVRADAIGELIDTAGREAAAQLLEAAY